MFRLSMPHACRALILMAACMSLAAQTPSTITGSVMDASGGAVSGAKLTATDQKTSVQKSTLADAAGQFGFDSLPPGTYTIKAEFPGFT